jgi:hypothetical protein
MANHNAWWGEKKHAFRVHLVLVLTSVGSWMKKVSEWIE